MMTLALLCFFLNYARKLYKLRRAAARYQLVQSSNLYCRWQEFSAEWVCHPFQLGTIRFHYIAGCHVLALDLVQSWSFSRPSIPAMYKIDGTATTVAPRPSHIFSLERPLLRRSSILIDMDLSSVPPTRRASPNGKDDEVIRSAEPIQEESDLFARKAGLGKLIKSAKQDIQVPEFRMDAFFNM